MAAVYNAVYAEIEYIIIFTHYTYHQICSCHLFFTIIKNTVANIVIHTSLFTVLEISTV